MKKKDIPINKVYLRVMAVDGYPQKDYKLDKYATEIPKRVYEHRDNGLNYSFERTTKKKKPLAVGDKLIYIYDLKRTNIHTNSLLGDENADQDSGA